MLSPSASVALGVHVSVLASYAVEGLRVTELMTGAVLPMLTLSVPLSLALPSLADALQTTVSPDENPELKVAPVPMVEPLTVHAYV
jgi:hypothetical protein